MVAINKEIFAPEYAARAQEIGWRMIFRRVGATTDQLTK